MKEPRSSDFLRSGSYKNTLLTILLVFLGIFFILQLSGHIFFSLGEKKPGQTGIKYLELSSAIFPLEAKSSCRKGYNLLEESMQPGASDSLNRGISALKRALKSNPLYYQAYLLLGKAYLYKNINDLDLFQEGLLNLKIAARLRGNKVWVSVDTLKILLAIWPHLEEEEKSFTKKLLGKSIMRMGGDDFNAILDIWGLYSRDISFFKDSIEKRPRYMKTLSNKLMHLEIELETRNRLLSVHAGIELEKIKNNFLKAREPISRESQKQIESLLAQMKKISSFFFIQPQDKLTRKSYLELKKEMIMVLIDILLGDEHWADHKTNRIYLEQHINNYMEDFSGAGELGGLSNFLQKNKNFDKTNLHSLYISQLLTFHSSQYETVITNSEDLRRSPKYISKNSMSDYSKIMLLLVDSYIASRLLTRASAILKELDTKFIDPEDIYWRKFQVERVIGPEREEDKRKSKYFNLFEQSRNIELNSSPIKKTVYLDGDKTIKITFGNWLEKRLKDFHLLQISEKGKIIYESYIGELSPPITIQLKSDRKYSRHSLTIKLN